MNTQSSRRLKLVASGLVGIMFGAIGLILWAAISVNVADATFGISIPWPWIGLAAMSGLILTISLLVEEFALPGHRPVFMGLGLALVGLTWCFGPGASSGLPMVPAGTPWNVSILLQLYRWNDGALYWNWPYMAPAAHNAVALCAVGFLIAIGGGGWAASALRDSKRLLPTTGQWTSERYRSEDTVFGNAAFGRWKTMRPEVLDWPAGVTAPGPDGATAGDFVLGEDYDPREGNRGYRHKAPETWGQGGKADLITMAGSFGSGHVLVFSGSGGGKSSAFVIPTALHATKEIIVGDPEGEVLERTRAAREAMGHKVRVIRKGHGFDVLALLRRYFETENEVFVHIAGMLLGEAMRGSDVGDYFREEAINIIAALLEHFTLKAQSSNAFDEIITIMTVDEPQFKDMIGKIAKKHDPRSTVYRCLGNYQSVEARFFQNFSTTVRQALKWAPYAGYLSMVTADPAGEPGLLDPGTDVFITLPLSDMRNNTTLMRLIYGALAYAVDRGSVERLIIIDEAAVLGRMSVFEQIRDEMRKKGARLMLIYQAMGQMEHAYGREGMRAWNNGAAARSYSRIEDLQELRELSELVGSFTVDVDAESRAVQSRAGAFASQSISQTDSVNIQSAKLITPDQLRTLPQDAQLLLFSGQPPLLCGKALWFRRPEWQERAS